jgi:acyl dehydratase
MNAPPPLREYGPITTADIAAICAATSDASPLHLDEDFARAAGHPTVVVPGTILMGWVGEYIEDWTGLAFRSLDWRVKLTGPVWPGDKLIIEGSPVPSTRADCRAGTVEVRTGDGRIVGKASFEVCDG